MTSYNLVGLAPNISRIYEIAKTGGFSVQLVVGSNNEFVTAKDIEALKAFYGFEETEDPDIVGEVCFDHTAIMQVLTDSHRCETMDAINARIAAVEFSSISVDRTIPKTGVSLLKTAIDRLKMGLVESMKCIEIAVVIAQLSGSETIRPEHIAEAIQYSKRQFNM